MNKVRWYHYLFLWLFETKYIGLFDHNSGVLFCFKYKKAFGRVYILDERRTPSLKKIKF